MPDGVMRDSSETPLYIIWNMNPICPYYCTMCCVDAVGVSTRGSSIYMKSTKTGIHRIDKTGAGSIYDQALRRRQELGLELTEKQKKAIVDNLKGHEIQFCISGGDPLVCKENIEIIKYCSELFGKENISVSTTQIGLKMVEPEEFAQYTTRINFSYDSQGNHVRPENYNESILQRLGKFKEHGISTTALVTLSKSTLDEESLRQIYNDLSSVADEIELIRYFPVGRGFGTEENCPTREEYQHAIEFLRELERETSGPSVRLQCSLKGLEDSENPCNLLSHRLYISNIGQVFVCPWSLGTKGEPINDAFVLGDLTKQKLSEILTGKTAQEFLEREKENQPHCKIFAYLHSDQEDTMGRIHDTSDPLYVK